MDRIPRYIRTYLYFTYMHTHQETMSCVCLDDSHAYTPRNNVACINEIKTRLDLFRSYMMLRITEGARPPPRVNVECWRNQVYMWALFQSLLATGLEYV